MSKSLIYADVEEIIRDMVGCEIEVQFDHTFKVTNGEFVGDGSTLKAALMNVFVKQLKCQYNIENPADQRLIQDNYFLDWMEVLRDHMPVKLGRCEGCNDEDCYCTGTGGCSNCDCGC
jgi:hypothetical protein